MDAVWINFLYNPLIPIGIFLSVCATFTFLVFLRGFLSGVLYLVTLNGNDDFLKHARQRTLWAFLMLIFLWSVWQMFLFIGSVLTGSPTPAGFGLAVVCLILFFVAYQSAKYLKKNAP